MNIRQLSFLRAVAVAVVGVGALSALPGVAHADLIVDANRYCSAGSVAANTTDTVPGSLLSVNDVTLSIGSSSSQASDCYGDFDAGNSSPTNETAALNTIFGSMSGPDQFVFLDKTGDASDPVGLGGIKFVVQMSGGSDGAPGVLTVAWTDTNALAAQNLPLTVDLAILLMGGNNNAAYLLSNLVLPLGTSSGTGTFDIQFFNGSGAQSNCECYEHDAEDYYYDAKYSAKYNKKNVKYSSYHYNKHKKHKHKKKKDTKECDPKQPSISHVLLAGRVVTTTIEVPEPTTMTMFGIGLAGLWAFRRRQRR